jgi:hypothetical protein
MKKIYAVFTAAFIALCITACGGNDDEINSSNSVSVEESSTAENNSTGSAESVLSGIKNEYLDASAYYGGEVYASNCKKLYGIELDDVEDGGIIYSSGGGYADEVSLIKMSDGSSAEGYLKERLSQRTNTFENYKPEEVDKLNSAQIFQVGDYWALVISDDAEDISQEIKDGLS